MTMRSTWAGSHNSDLSSAHHSQTLLYRGSSQHGGYLLEVWIALNIAATAATQLLHHAVLGHRHNTETKRGKLCLVMFPLCVRSYCFRHRLVSSDIYLLLYLITVYFGESKLKYLRSAH